jgi:hypothetical protein
MNVPKTIWNYLLDTETDRIINTVFHTVNFFFESRGFYVLPFEKKHNLKSVFLPDLGFNFQTFKQIGYLKPRIPMHAPKEVFLEVQKQLAKTQWRIPDLALQNYRKEWSRFEAKFWQITKVVFPKVDISTVEIRLTRFGSLSSFDKRNNDLYLQIRYDTDISFLAEAIVSALVIDQLKKRKSEWQDKGWEEREATIDNLFTIGSYSKLFSNYMPTLVIVRAKKQGNLVQISNNYLNKLGVKKEELFKIDNDSVLINGASANSILTATENKILACLVTNRNKFVSYDELSYVWWEQSNMEKYSPWALAKMIERLRKKLIRFGVSPNLIRVKRKYGYILEY